MVFKLGEEKERGWRFPICCLRATPSFFCNARKEVLDPLNEIIIISPILLGRTQSILAKLKSLCQSLNVKEQCRKRRSTDSPLLMHNMHQ